MGYLCLPPLVVSTESLGISVPRLNHGVIILAESCEFLPSHLLPRQSPTFIPPHTLETALSQTAGGFRIHLAS